MNIFQHSKHSFWTIAFPSTTWERDGMGPTWEREGIKSVETAQKNENKGKLHNSTITSKIKNR